VLSVGGTRTAALQRVGIDWSTFYKWLDQKPEFAGNVARAEADAELRFTTPIATAANAGDWRAAAFWLERRRPKEWGLKQEISGTIQMDMASLIRSHLAAPEPLPEPTIIDVDAPEDADTSGGIEPHTNGTA